MKILKYPNKNLRRHARAVKNFDDPQLHKLISDMVKAMEEAKGIGLAATQVGSDLKICTIEIEGSLMILLNPKITSSSKKKVAAEEGCLSFPGKYLIVERSAKVKVRAEDPLGKKLKIKAEGLLARALQHEIDHLEGILIIDRVKKSRHGK